MKKIKLDMDVYIEKFHTLGGTTLSEHQKNFSLYVKTLESDTSFDPVVFFGNLHPKNHQEEIFHVRLLQKFNCHSELIDVLTSGNRILTKIALKDTDFLKALLNKYTKGSKFTEELTPRVSYVTRVNLVNKLASLVEDEGMAEEFYTNVYGRYGLRSARAFLIKCRPDFVKRTVFDFELRLNDCELIALHRKSPEMFEEYIKNNRNQNYGLKVSTYLVKVDLVGFHRVSALGKFTLGKKFTKRYVRAYKEELIADLRSFLYKLSRRRIAMCLRADEMIKLFERQTHSYRYQGEVNYLLNYPRKLRGYILFTAYRNVNGCEFYEHAKNVDEELLGVLSLEDRLKFACLHKYPTLLPLAEAMAAIKAKINVTSDMWERGKLCVALLEACLHNEQHTEDLLDVLKYFHGCHKNDNAQVHAAFLDFLASNFETFTKPQWDVIEELLCLLEVNGDRFHSEAELLSKLAVYQLSNGIVCFKTLGKFTKAVYNYTTDFSEWLGSYEKNYILLNPELITQIYKEEYLIGAKLHHLNIVINYNKRHAAADRINPYDYFEIWSLAIEKNGEDKIHWTGLIVKLLECKPQNDAERMKFNEFWTAVCEARNQYTAHFYKWLLQNRPSVIFDDPRNFFRVCDTRLLYDINKFHFLRIPQVLDACGLEMLSGDYKSAAIAYFSHQAKSVDLLITLCATETSKIDARGERTREMLDVQTSLMRSFKYTPFPSRLTGTLLRFCNGDYLRHSLEPLYFLMYHTAEDEIETTINELLDRAVSVRKHAAHLASALGSIELQTRVYSAMAEGEKNISVRKYVFGKLYNHFINEKTPASWQLLSNNMKLVTIYDCESLHKLKSVNNVPKKFLNVYLIAVWDFFTAFRNKSQFDLISHFNRDVNDTNIEDFYIKVITASLFNADNEFTRDAEICTAKYLLMKADSMDVRFDFVWNLIRTRASERGKRRILTTFCTAIKTKTPDITHQHLIDLLITNKQTLNISQDALSVDLKLNSTKFYTHWDKRHTTLTDYIAQEHDSVIGVYSPQILHLYAEFAVDFLNGCFDYGERSSNILCVVRSLLERDAKKFGVLAYLMLPADFKNCATSMRDVVVILKGDLSCVIKAYMDKYLSKHPEFDDV